MKRILPLVAAVFCLAGPVAPVAADDPAATLYQSNRVDVIELGLSQEAIDDLEAEPEAYVKGTFELAETDGTPGGKKPFLPQQNVEVRLKGDASFKDLSGKAAFKLKFAKTEPFMGLRKMTLNNMVEDPSMTHETLAYTAFRAAGVPASRTSFAYVYVNGVDYGLHLDIENLDKVALEKRFGAFQKPPQHLYEGENGTDVRAADTAKFEIDEGDETSRADLEALIAAVNSSGSTPWSTRVAATADLQEMSRMWAVEKYVGQYDGYTSGESPFQPNNYYLYSDPTGRFQMFPWGTDETWQERNHLAFDEGHGLLFTHCLDDAACLATYRGAVATSCDAIGGVGLDALAASTANLLAPWQQLEQGNGNRHEHDLGEIADGVAETRAFVAARPAEAADWLGEPCHTTPPPTPGIPPGPGSTPASTTTTQILPTPAALRVVRAKSIGGAISTQLNLGVPGTVVQRATLATADGPLLACHTRFEADRAGDLTSTCPLTAAARKRLHTRWLRVSLVTSFFPSSSAAESDTRRVHLPRLVPSPK
jgi:hypothetical protein